MKNKLWISVLFVLVVLAFTQTQAGIFFWTGNKLVELMTEYDKANANASDANYAKAMIYGAYIIGVCDATRWLYDIPDHATQGQVVAVVAKFFKENPERWSEPAADLVIDALQKAFPLKNKK
ncbi:MAG: Rap1a/Tai family immunity protein [Candidatus Zixiibacteriota bacterium]